MTDTYPTRDWFTKDDAREAVSLLRRVLGQDPVNYPLAQSLVDDIRLFIVRCEQVEVKS